MSRKNIGNSTRYIGEPRENETVGDYAARGIVALGKKLNSGFETLKETGAEYREVVETYGESFENSSDHSVEFTETDHILEHGSTGFGSDD